MWTNKFLIVVFLIVSFYLGAEEISIGSIILQGNQLISDKEIYSAILSQPKGAFDQKRLNEDTARIVNLYEKKGVLHVKVFLPEIKTRNSLQIDIIFKIDEKQDLLISKLEFIGNRYISSQKILSLIPVKIQLVNLHLILKDVMEFYTENGFLFATVKLDSLSYKEDDLIAFCTIDEGGYCEFEEFRFQGNKVTKDNILIKISGLQAVEKITPSIMEKAADNLRQKQYIKECEILPLDHRQLLISIIEDRMSLFSGIIGYDNSRENEEKLTGFVNMEFLNLYGTDRNLTFLWQRLNADRSSIEMSYHESGPNRIPLSADISISRLEADSTYIQTTFETDIYYYNLRNRYGTYFALDDIFSGSRRPITIEKTNYQKIGAFWQYSDLDNFQNPTKGTEFKIKYYYVFNKIENRNISKQAVEVNWNFYRQIFPKMVFATGINTKLLENKELRELEYFNLGGSKNLRGFTEDQFPGFRVGWVNTELRYLLSRSSRFFIFTDYGYVESESRKHGKLFGFGFGIRIQTRLGLLGLDYGFSYDDTGLRNPLDGIIHFGLESKL